MTSDIPTVLVTVVAQPYGALSVDMVAQFVQRYSTEDSLC